MSLLTAFLALGCGRIGYYPMGLEAELSAPEGGVSMPDGGAPSEGGVDAGTTPSGPALGCSGERLVRHWGFDQSLEQWEYRPPYLETATWSPEGHAADGAVRFETPDAPHGWLVLPESLGDLQGRRGSVWLKLEAGGPLNVLAYVSNGNDYGADRDITLTPGDWTCFEFDFDAPSTPGFAPKDVQIFGFALNASGPVTLLIDDVGIQ
jgi:hypothetical protein